MLELSVQRRAADEGQSLIRVCRVCILDMERAVSACRDSPGGFECSTSSQSTPLPEKDAFGGIDGGRELENRVFP